MHRRNRNKNFSDYVLPFLILVGIGIIGVLGFKLFATFQSTYSDVHFYVVEGKAKMLHYGLTEWESAFSGTRLLTGDSVKTLKNSKMVLQFYNGSMVRLGPDTSLTLVDVDKRDDGEKIILALSGGTIWVNKIPDPFVKESSFEISTPHMIIKNRSTVFEVESIDTEFVRVFDGKVEIDILADPENKKEVTETIEVGVGQEIYLDSAILNALNLGEDPSLLLAVDDDFKLSAWYQWNIKEDKTPTDFSKKVILEEEPVEEPVEEEEVPEVDTVPEVEPEIEEEDVVLSAPVISEPTIGERTLTEGKSKIIGTVDKGTEKVVVEYNGQEYALKLFEAGDTEFTYNLSEDFGNLKPGSNVYKIYAVNSIGTKSESAEIEIIYKKKSEPEVVESEVVEVDPKIESGQVEDEGGAGI